MTGYGETVTWDAQADADIEPAVARPGAFSLLFSSAAGMQVFRLDPGEVKVVGRASPAELILDDRSLSRRHARLSWQADGVQVEDLGSKNGTQLDGAPISKTLLHADSARQLRLGHVLLTVRRQQDSALPGFDDCERFLARLDEELLRARTFQRPVSLLMLRAVAPVTQSDVALRVRKELRAVDSMAQYARGVWLVLAPELGLADALSAARWLLRARTQEPQLVCGVASSESCPTASSAHTLLAAVSGACRAANQAQPIVSAGKAPSEPPPRDPPVVLCPRMVALYEIATRAASREAPVLILGETGTGKELVARHIHAASARSTKPFVALNCGAIPRELVETTLFGHERGAFSGASELRRGVFEEAHGGTLFLDELGELPLPAQAALLRVLETKQSTRVGGTRPLHVDVRVISATHCNLEAMVRERSFRADLYHRLNLVTLRVPALRERSQEIAPLAQHFVARGAGAPSVRLSAAALAYLQQYPWPGNVRELRNVIEYTLMLHAGQEIGVADLPEHVRRAPPTAAGEAAAKLEQKRFAEQVRSVELDLIRDALRRTGNNQTQAARLLNMPLRTLVYKLRAYGLRRADADERAE